MEYEIKINITKLLRVNGLCEHLASYFETLDEIVLLVQGKQPVENEDQTDWLHDMTTILMKGRYPQGLDRSKKR